LIATGMWTQAGGIAVIALSEAFFGFAMGSALLVWEPRWSTRRSLRVSAMSPCHRGAPAIGVYRFWRDLGYALGALIAGVTADMLGLAGAFWIVAGSTFISGLIVAFRMRGTLSSASVGQRKESPHESRA
jgi:hypothetical protein